MANMQLKILIKMLCDISAVMRYGTILLYCPQYCIVVYAETLKLKGADVGSKGGPSGLLQNHQHAEMFRMRTT